MRALRCVTGHPPRPTDGQRIMPPTQHVAKAQPAHAHGGAVTTVTLPCKPMDDGSTSRSCAAYCKPLFRAVHCQFCSCADCTFCTMPAPPPPPRPPPSPPPPPPAPATPLELINAMWRDGKPSSTVRESGVLVRQFDALSKVSSFAPCPEHMWCAKYRKRSKSTCSNNWISYLHKFWRED